MTAQMNDTFTYEGTEYSVAGINGKGLFDPGEHGLKPVSGSTACWRGFVCHYRIREGRLELGELDLDFGDEDSERAERGTGCLLNGKAPVRTGAPSTRLFDWRYEDNGLAIPFTGGLLLAKDFIEDLYVHMGFHPAWKYRRVVELLFDKGVLHKAADRSDVLASVRERMARKPLEPFELEEDKEVRDWIEKCFSRDYDG